MEEQLLFTEKGNSYYEVTLADSGKVAYWLQIYPEKDLLIHKWIGYLTDDSLKAIWLYFGFCRGSRWIQAQIYCYKKKVG